MAPVIAGRPRQSSDQVEQELLVTSSGSGRVRMEGLKLLLLYNAFAYLS